MLSKSKLWALIEPAVKAEGLELFDLDLPSAKSGVLRIYISRSTSGRPSPEGERGGVDLDDCVLISRKLSNMTEFEEMLPERITLEVSSPGVNRRLRRPEHFAGAIGEHVSLKIVTPEDRVVVKKGVLRAFDGTELHVEEDGSRELITVPLSDVSSARVDYIFQ